MNAMTIQEARQKGYVRGAKIELGNELRIMRSGRIKAENGTLIALESSPFVIYQLGHWCGNVLTSDRYGTQRTARIPAAH